MSFSALQIAPLSEGEEAPYFLMELADPARELIAAYLKKGSCHVARAQGKVVGVLVLLPLNPHTMEIKNIAVSKAEQGKGIGKSLLHYAAMRSREAGYKHLLIGTGNSSLAQLRLYQQQGFEVHSIENNFFLKHYSEPIFENGIQCKHMIMLRKPLQ